MAQSGVLPPQFTDELVAMAKFRNRLVHLYWEVSDSQVYEILKSRLGDFTRLLEFLSNYLGWEDGLI
jgi:uncharacterized protein YutE (UPF0331/DUF86 family)